MTRLLWRILATNSHKNQEVLKKSGSTENVHCIRTKLLYGSAEPTGLQRLQSAVFVKLASLNTEGKFILKQFWKGGVENLFRNRPPGLICLLHWGREGKDSWNIPEDVGLQIPLIFISIPFYLSPQFPSNTPKLIVYNSSKKSFARAVTRTPGTTLYYFRSKGCLESRNNSVFCRQ